MVPLTVLSTQTTPAKQVAEIGQRLYEDKLRQKLEVEYPGKFAAIDASSGNYFIGETFHQAIQKAQRMYPNKVFYTVKIGFPAVYSFASGGTISTTTTL